MKNLRRWHLYLGCFFTPLLLFYLFSGFILTRDPSRQKLPSEAETLLQKFYWVHTAQFYPTDSSPQHHLVEIAEVDIEKETLSLAEPRKYPPGLPGKVINIPPGGLTDTDTYYAHPKSSKTLTLHRTPADAKTGANPIDLTDEGIPPLTFLPENPPPRAATTYSTTTFRWFVYLMSIGVLATMTLGVVLAVKVVKDKKPVIISLAVGFLLPCIFLMLGHSKKPIPPEPKPTPAEESIPKPSLPAQPLPGSLTITPPSSP